MARVYNFSAGPSILPEVVLKQAADEMLDYQGSGQSVMEMSHRSKTYDAIIKEAEKDLRDLMNIPDNYKVLFLQGGASQQFAAVPMNLMKNGVADYIITGQWAKKAYQEAKKYGKANAVASSEDKTFSYIPDCSDLPIDDDADYVYICHNNTIYGTAYKTLPNTKGKILVADMSSDILSQPVNVSDYGLIYFGVQKNVGPAGVVVVIIREDLIRDDLPEFVPTMLKYKTQADAESAITAAGLVVGDITEVNSDTVAAGSVIEQDPATGTNVDSGSPVNFVISLGKEEVYYSYSGSVESKNNEKTTWTLKDGNQNVINTWSVDAGSSLTISANGMSTSSGTLFYETESGQTGSQSVNFTKQ